MIQAHNQNFFESLHKEQWKEVRLGEVGTIITGKTPSYNNPQDWGHSMLFITPTDYKNYHKYASDSARKISDIGLKRFTKIILPKNSILVTCIGSDMGKVVMNKIEAITNQQINSIIPNQTINYDFLYYSMVNMYPILRIFGSDGTAVPILNKGDFENLTIPLPPLEVQQQIAEILSSFDDKIDLLHRQNKTLESLALTLFRHTFIDNPNRNEWEMGKLGDYITPKKGKNITQKNAIKGIYPVIAGGLEPAYYHNQSNTESPVITISASGANAGFVNIHYRPVWSSDSSYIDKTITPYVYFFYLFLKMNQNILYDKQEGSAQPHIYLMELEMPYCPKDLIETFESQMQIYFDKISHNMKEILNLESMRDMLLAKILKQEY